MPLSVLTCTGLVSFGTLGATTLHRPSDGGIVGLEQSASAVTVEDDGLSLEDHGGAKNAQSAQKPQGQLEQLRKNSSVLKSQALSD